MVRTHFVNSAIKLVSVEPSESRLKKYDAKFRLLNGVYKTVSFGAKNYQDLTTIADKEEGLKKRDLYIIRHKKREEALWASTPDCPATCSRYILWEYHNLPEAIDNFRKRFNLL